MGSEEATEEWVRAWNIEVRGSVLLLFCVQFFKGKDEPDYRYGYDQHGASESRSHYNYPTGSSERRRSYSGGGGYDASLPVHELMVPMCCDKCVEKVEEELGEVEGVRHVSCDQYKQRVRIVGSNIDIARALKKAEKAVSKKCELLNSSETSSMLRDDDKQEIRYTNHQLVHPSSRSSGGLVRSNSFDRNLGRLPSFGPVSRNNRERAGNRDLYEPRGLGASNGSRDLYETRGGGGYGGFGRMPSFNKHRHHDAEYITDFVDERRGGPEPRDARRDYYSNLNRLPSFNKHRHHDAEYIASDDRDYGGNRGYYESDSLQQGNNGGGAYRSQYYEGPRFQSQPSFSKLPVTNPHYVKHIAYWSSHSRKNFTVSDDLAYQT